MCEYVFYSIGLSVRGKHVFKFVPGLKYLPVYQGITGDYFAKIGDLRWNRVGSV